MTARGSRWRASLELSVSGEHRLAVVDRQPDDQPCDCRATGVIGVQHLGEEHAEGHKRRVDSLLERDACRLSAALTIAASRISETGEHSFGGLESDLTFSEIHRRVAWGMVGLLAGTALGSAITNPCPMEADFCLSQLPQSTYGFPSAIRGCLPPFLVPTQSYPLRQYCYACPMLLLGTTRRFEAMPPDRAASG